MPLAYLFWMVFILAVLFFLVDAFGSWPHTRFAVVVVFLILIGLLGWQTFGGPVK